MTETVNAVAQSFLRELSQKGMKSVPVQHTAFYSETFEEPILRTDRAFTKEVATPPQRFELSEEIQSERFVLKHGKKYFYGFKNTETKWTYEPRLASTVSEGEAEALSRHMETCGTPVHRLPAPLHLINPSGKKVLRFESLDAALVFAESRITGQAWAQRLKEIAAQTDLPSDEMDRCQEEFETWANQQSL